MNFKKDYYQTLGVAPDADQTSIRAAYREMAKRYHPDKNPGDSGAEEKCKDINEAYEVLSDPLNRSVYDAQFQTAKADAQATVSPASKPYTETKFRVFTVTREQKIYVEGKLTMKFQGKPEWTDPYLIVREQQYRIIPTECELQSTESAIYSGDIPPLFLQNFAKAMPLSSLPVLLRTIVQTKDEEKIYQLQFRELRVADPLLKDITKHEQDSFGTLEADAYGYLVHYYEEEVTEAYECYSGYTGEVETKLDTGVYYMRQQSYYADGSTYWEPWTVVRKAPKTSPNYSRRQSSVAAKEVGCAPFAWAIILITLLLVQPQFVLGMLVLAAAFLCCYLLASLVGLAGKHHGWLYGLFLFTLLFWGWRNFSHPFYPAPTASTTKPVQATTQANTLTDPTDSKDSVLWQRIQWRDTDSNQYDIHLELPYRAIRQSTAMHQAMESSPGYRGGMNDILAQLYVQDAPHLNGIAASFRELSQFHQLDEKREAAMIVSCIQSLPYVLVMDKDCSADGASPFSRQFLASCTGDCCLPDQKFGVLSPLEFLRELKGDCDSRALLLYSVFSELGYDVALMTSPHYQHAMLAIHFRSSKMNNQPTIQIDSRPYFFWETTGFGFQPGNIAASMSDMQYWQIALIHKTY